MNGALSRTQLLAQSAKGGAALMIGGSVAGALAGPAAADVISDADLAYARLLVGAELLAADFYARAIAVEAVRRARAEVREARALQRAGALRLRRAILNGAGQPPAVAGDIDFAYPKELVRVEGGRSRRSG